MVCIGRGQRVRVGGSGEQIGLLWDDMEIRGIVASRVDWQRERGLLAEERRGGWGEEEGEGMYTQWRCSL